MHEYAILFTYHGGARPDVLAQNLDRLAHGEPLENRVMSGQLAG